MIAGADRGIRWTTIAGVGLRALIAGTVSYLHMHRLVELRGQLGWVAALTPFSVKNQGSKAGWVSAPAVWGLLMTIIMPGTTDIFIRSQSLHGRRAAQVAEYCPC